MNRYAPGVDRSRPSPRTFPVLAAIALVGAAALPSEAGGPPERRTWSDAPAPAQEVGTARIPDTPAGKRLEWLLDLVNGSPKATFERAEEHFTPMFLQAAEAGAMERSIRRLRAERADSDGADRFELKFVNPGYAPTMLTGVLRSRESGVELRLELGVDPETNKIDILDLRPVSGGSGGDPTLKTGFEEFPGGTSLFAAEVPGPGEDFAPVAVMEFNPRRALAIGSASRLFVAAAAGRAVAGGALSWDEPIEADPGLRSLPWSRTAALAPGATIAARDLARAALFDADATATDLLANRIGRDTIERTVAALAEQPELNVPFLTTRERWVIEQGPHGMLCRRWAEADERERRRMLGRKGPVGRGEPSVLVHLLQRRPVCADGAGWFASAADLCTALSDMVSRDAGVWGGALERDEPGVDRSVWPRGVVLDDERFGVRTIAGVFERDDGRWFAIAAVWNAGPPGEGEPAPDRTRFRAEFDGALGQVAGWDRRE